MSEALNEFLPLRLRKKKQNFKRYTSIYIMVSIPIIWFIVFKYIPMFGLIISIKDYSIRSGTLFSPWANPIYKYFTQFLHGPYFWQLLKNTLLINTYILLFGMLPPLILAILLHESQSNSLKRIVQSLTYMPHFLSWVIIYGIVYVFFSEINGIVNDVFSALGYSRISFLNSSRWFRTILVISAIWQGAGWGAIIYIAAISGIDPCLYESAQIDGANRFQKAWYITIPSVLHIFVLLLILNLGQLMNAGFDQVFIFYNVQVYDVGDIINTWVYRTGLEQLNFSLASAVGFFNSFIGMILVISANSLAKKIDRSIW